MPIRRVTVYAASSQGLAAHYYTAAAALGQVLAEHGLSIVYGGGRHGLMGAMADAALAHGAHVEGVIPDFLQEMEAGHTGLSRLTVVGDLHTRKRLMLDGSHAVVCLPGGCGTFEELFEAMTFKRLGLFSGPIVLVNTAGYYDRCLDWLRYSITERFMSEAHGAMWQVVLTPEEVPEALVGAPEWSEDARRFCAVTRDPELD